MNKWANITSMGESIFFPVSKPATGLATLGYVIRAVNESLSYWLTQCRMLCVQGKDQFTAEQAATKELKLKSDVVNKEVLSDSPVVITHLPFKSEKSEPFNGPNVKLNNILTNFITVISDCLLLLCKTLKITTPLDLQ